MKQKKEKSEITVAELINELNTYDPESKIIFGDDELTLYRTKRRGDKLVQIEFNEIIQTTDEDK